MSWSDTMQVEVGYEITQVPTDDHIWSMRSAAETLTDNKSSVSVKQSEKGERYVIVAIFSMRKMAQYKIVSDIAHQFKLSFACHHDYTDTWIAFPKERPRRRR